MKIPKVIKLTERGQNVPKKGDKLISTTYTGSHRPQKKFFAIYESDCCARGFGYPSRHTPCFDTMDEVIKWMGENKVHIGETFDVSNDENGETLEYRFPITSIEFCYRWIYEGTGNIVVSKHVLDDEGNILHEKAKHYYGDSTKELDAEMEQHLKQTMYTYGLKETKDGKVFINVENARKFMGASRRELGEV